MGFCVVGAIRRASERLEDDIARYICMETMHELAGKRGYENVADWNDAPGRTEAEVMSLLGDALQVRRERSKTMRSELVRWGDRA